MHFACVGSCINLRIPWHRATDRLGGALVPHRCDVWERGNGMRVACAVQSSRFSPASSRLRTVSSNFSLQFILHSMRNGSSGESDGEACKASYLSSSTSNISHAIPTWLSGPSCRRVRRHLTRWKGEAAETGRTPPRVHQLRSGESIHGVILVRGTVPSEKAASGPW